MGKVGLPAIPTLCQKNSDRKPAKKKELLCFVPRARNFFMIAPPNKEGCTAQCQAMGGATAKSCLPLFRGRDPDSTRWISVFYSFQLSLQSTKITLCSPTPIHFPKNPISLLTIYPGSYCTFCQGKTYRACNDYNINFLC
jgi:hypothetical protein